jgi:hypothetical protein
MSRAEYRGFIIEARPHQLADDGRWTTTIEIVRHHGDSVESKGYSAGNTFATTEEATHHCLTFGRQIIDGDVRDFDLN